MKERWSKLTLLQKFSVVVVSIMCLIVLILELLTSTSILYKLFYSIVVPNLMIFGFFWWRRDKRNSFDKKRLQRYGWIALITTVIMWSSYGSFSIDGVRTYGDIEDVKDAIDVGLDGLNDEYIDLCDDKRNDQLKESFELLRNDILLIADNCFKNKNLSSQEQLDAHEYYLQQLEDYPSLKSLTFSKISCW